MNSPCSLTSLTCWPFSSPTIRGLHTSLKLASASLNRTFCMSHTRLQCERAMPGEPRLSRLGETDQPTRDGLVGPIALTLIPARQRHDLLGFHSADVFGDLHGAELRAAHAAEMRALERVLRQRLVVHAARGLWIERQTKLLVPVEREAGPR